MFSERFLTRARIEINENTPDEYPYNLPVIRSNSTISFDQQVTIYQINEDGKLETVRYEETEYFTLYKYFMNNPQGFIGRLFDKPE